MTAFALAFTSCSDKEEIDINYFHDVTLSISCTKMYDSVKEDIEKFLGTNLSYSVEYTTFVYNDQGKFVREYKQHSRLFETNVVLNGLQHGTYTFITTVSLAENKSSIWIYDKKENLNSIQVSTKPEKMYDGIEYYNSLGVSVQKIEVQDNVTVSITPELMGCYIELACENVNKYTYPELLFTLKQAPTYLILNTFEQITEEILDETTYWVRGQLDLMKTDKPQKMFLMQKGGINYGLGIRTQEQADTHDTHFYHIHNGEFNLEKGKYYKAFWLYAGEAASYKNQFKSFFGSIKDYDLWYSSTEKENPLFKHPYTSWGDNVNNLKQFMDEEGYELWYDIRQDDNGFYYLGYNPLYKENSIQYIFETETTNLLYSFVNICKEDASVEDILDQLNKSSEYAFDKYYEKYGCYIYYNKQTLIGIYPDCVFEDGTEYTELFYEPRTFTDTRSMSDIKVHMNKFNNAKKQLFK